MRLKTALTICCFTLTFTSILSAQPAPGLPTTVTLDQAIQEAMDKNLDLAAERYNVSVSEAREITANLRPNPVLTVSGSTLDVFGYSYNSNSPLGPNQLNVHTDVPIERGHKREERLNVAKADTTLAQLGVREVMRQVIFRVQNAFVDVQQAKNNLALQQENLKNLRDLVTVNQARANGGDLAPVELNRSQVQTALYQAQLQQAQLALDQAKAQLQFQMGRAQRSPNFDVIGDLRRDTVIDTPVEILQRALTIRPDYLSGQQTQARSQADLRLQLANGKQDYVIGAEINRQAAYGISGQTMGFSFSIPMPIFNKNQGEILRAQRDIDLSGARKKALEASINLEVDQAYQQYAVSRRVLGDIETDMLAKSRSVRDTTEYSYRRGEASLVEFLDAQRAFNEFTQTFLDAQASYARSLYLIDTVSGTTVSGR